MRLVINIEANIPAELEDNLRDVLASAVENILTLVDPDPRVGTRKEN